jgi:hypothetical protein
MTNYWIGFLTFFVPLMFIAVFRLNITEAALTGFAFGFLGAEIDEMIEEQ